MRQLSLDAGVSVRADVLDRLAERHEEDTLQTLLRTIGDTAGPVPVSVTHGLAEACCWVGFSVGTEIFRAPQKMVQITTSPLVTVRRSTAAVKWRSLASKTLEA